MRVGGGCTWGEVDAATNPHGLATPSGIIATTGVGGLTLGGGLGHLTRKCGLAIDNLLEAEMVLASGERVRANADEHSDLYWAIRGGGGNFGVVTSFLFRLHEVDTVIAGPTFWPVEAGVEVLSAYREFLPGAPRELNGFYMNGAVPPAPPFPEELHGRTVCGVVWCHTGSEEEAAAAMAPFLDALPEPLMHGVQPMPHPALQGAFDGLYPAGDQWYWRADFVKEIPDEAVALHAKFGAELPTIKSTMHLYPIDGAAHDVGPSDTRLGVPRRPLGRRLRRRRPGPGERRRDPRLERRLPGGAAPVLGRRRLREHDDGGGPGAGPRELRRTTTTGSPAIKAEYDPDNTFRINQNIEPALIVRRSRGRRRRRWSRVRAGFSVAARPAQISTAPPSSSALGRSPSSSAALAMPNTGTSSANGVTAAAVWRFSSEIHAAKPNSPLTSATNSSAATPATSTPASAAPISAWPSNANERPSSGSGATRLAQTSSASASGGCAIRVSVLLTPQAAAAPTTSTNGRIGALAARSIPITASPANAIAAPATCSRRGRSPSTTAAIAIVKITCSWSSSEESPTGSPWSRLTNSSPNLTTPSAAPIPST